MIAPALALVALCATGVDSVVVYPDRAQVTRAAEVPCRGRAEVRFDAIPPAADPRSLRAIARQGTIEGLRTVERPQEAAFSKERARLEDEIREVERQLREVDDEEARLKNQAELGGQLEASAATLVSRDLPVSRPDTRAWGTAFDAALAARLEAATKSADLSARRRTLSWRLEDLRRQAARLGGAAGRKELAAEVLVRCASGTARVELTYLVGGASWTPAYEARAAEPDGVSLTTFATVRQSTGEDWRGARVALSTAIPSQDATPPELQRLIVSAQKRDERKVLVRREEAIEHARQGAGADAAGTEGLAARAQGLSVQLEVPRRSDVPGDGAEVRLFVGRHKLPAQFSWRTAPTLAPFVFRVAEATNTSPWPLLPGNLDAFGRGGFAGRSALERTARGAPLRVTFGLEDSVKVKRTVLEEVKRDQGLINQRKRFRYAYRFDVQSFADRPMELVLEDRIPVSELEDVPVTLAPQTTKGFEHQKQDGVLTWRVRLAPRAATAVDLAFFVDVPESYDSGGL